MSFKALLDELEVMAKALPADGADGDDDKIAAAAEDAGGSAKKKAMAELDLDKEDDEAGEQDEGMTKSFRLRLEDGTEVDAIDGGAMLKALVDRVERNEGDMAKALGQAVSLIKSLNAKVAEIGNTGRGRKAVVNVSEKPSPTMAKAQDGIPAAEFMTKALGAMSTGKVSGDDVRRAEAYINRGLKVPDEIVARVLS